MALDEKVVEQMTNGDLIGDTVRLGEPQRVEQEERPPLPSQLLGANLALLVGSIAAHLPQELAPQSRYQVAVDLAKTVIGSQLAQALAP
jgi:hypothetical protein